MCASFPETKTTEWYSRCGVMAKLIIAFQSGVFVKAQWLTKNAFSVLVFKTPENIVPQKGFYCQIRVVASRFASQVEMAITHRIDVASVYRRCGMVTMRPLYRTATITLHSYRSDDRNTPTEPSVHWWTTKFSQRVPALSLLWWVLASSL